MASGQKVAQKINRRMQTPIIRWIRDKLFAVYRQDITPPPGPYTADGKCVFRDPNRYADEMSTKEQPLPKLPGGVNHRLYNVSYYERDSRRKVQPPLPIYEADEKEAEFKSLKGEPIKREEAVPINKGPDSNFGLAAPTPGFGVEWVRDNTYELETQKKSKELAYLQKFDRFTASQ